MQSFYSTELSTVVLSPEAIEFVGTQIRLVLDPVCQFITAGNDSSRGYRKQHLYHNNCYQSHNYWLTSAYSQHHSSLYDTICVLITINIMIAPIRIFGTFKSWYDNTIVTKWTIQFNENYVTVVNAEVVLHCLEFYLDLIRHWMCQWSNYRL